ncbi:MAG: histidine kinase dimerization/phosphoacceptor domain -containing protein [Candidatus Competibacteraceae bacterium]
MRVSKIGIFDHDHQTDTIYWSPEQRKNYGWDQEETVTLEKFLAQVFPADRERIGEAVKRAHDPAGDGLFDVEHRIIRRDGAIRWLTTRSQTFFAGEGNACRAVRTVGAVLDTTESVQAEESLKSAFDEKVVLLREVHHRVKNNMQIISSLLDLQADSLQDERMNQLFKECQQRIRSMALIHENLYQSQDISRVDFAEYLCNLTEHLSKVHNNNDINLRLDTIPVSLNIETAIPCGLIFNELVSNAFKHAFPSGQDGEIHMTVETDGDQSLILTIADNGIGLPSELDFQKSPSLGLTLVSTLVQQLKGQITLNQETGTQFTIHFRPS